MKKTLLFLSIAAISIISVSCKKTNLDGVTVLRGGGGSSGGVVHEYPDFFKRNNGNGTCGGEGQIRAQYASCPVEAPTLLNVYNLNADNSMTVIPGLRYGAGVTSPCENNHSYMSYCYSGGNIPPITKVVLEFTWSDGFTILLNSEGDPYIL